MSTQSYLVTVVHRITSVESEKMTRDTRTAIVTHEWSRSIGRRSETDPPSTGEGDFVLWGCLRTLRRDQSHVFRAQW